MADDILTCKNTRLHNHCRVVDKHDPVSSPMLYLPVDIWELIFLHCLPSKISDTLITDNLTTTTPLLLCQVCQPWRDLAISMPLLWCSLHIVVAEGNAYPTLELVSLWLSRSRALPISISLSQVNNWYQNQHVVAIALNLFKKHLSRWQRVSFDLAGPEPRRLLSPSDAHAPLLQDLSIRTFRIGVSPEEDLFRIFEHELPLLSRFSVSFVPPIDYKADGIALKIPWSQFTYLSIDYMPSIQEAVDVLSECHSLEHYVFGTEISLRTTLSTLTKQLIHKTLRVLELDVECYDFRTFLDCTVLPALDSLTIRGKDTGLVYWPYSQLEDHFQRSSTRLRTLHLRTAWIWDPHPLHFIQHPALQSLVKLNIEDELDWTYAPCFTRLVQAILEAHRCSLARILPVYETPWALPSLEALDIRGYISTIDIPAFLTMAEVRWRGHHNMLLANRLNFLHIFCHRPFSFTAKDHKRIEQLKKEGMDIAIA